MTRRIVLAILLSAWAVVLVALVVVYFTTRQALVAQLDQSIILRASNLPQLLGVSHQGMTALPSGDRYVIRNELGQIIVRPDGQATAGSAPLVKDRRFASLGDGTRVRSITITLALPPPDAQSRRLATIVYSAPADAVEGLLRRMAILLAAVAVGGGLLIGGVALLVSKIALRPLRQTADVIGTI